MWFAALLFTVMADLVWAQSNSQGSELFTLINGTQKLSDFAPVLLLFPQVLDNVAGLSNITILAPSNDAFEALEADPRGEALENAGQEDYISLIYYHILSGSYDNITDYEIAPTLLTNTNYTNATGGQVVGAFFDDDEEVIGFYSGLDIHPEGP